MIDENLRIHKIVHQIKTKNLGIKLTSSHISQITTFNSHFI